MKELVSDSEYTLSDATDISAESDTALLPQLFMQGYARVRLDAQTETPLLSGLHHEATRFFDLSQGAKLSHALPNLTNGYRPPESVHATDPENPDTNDSFIHWGEEQAKELPGHGKIRPFLQALEAYRAVVATKIMGRLMTELCTNYEYEHDLPFERASLLQVNSFGNPSERELLQTVHEDGTLATVIWTSAPGLEGFHDDRLIPLTPASNEVFVMPGGILELMTGGEIGAFYHQARNHGDTTRKSIMYFSCPDIDRPDITPFVENSTNKGVSIRDAILHSTDMFGLTENFVVHPSNDAQQD